MRQWILAFSLFLSLLSLCFACRQRPQHEAGPAASASSFEEPQTLSDRIEQATFILIAEVQGIESWKGRKDWWVVTLKPEKVIKGHVNSNLRILSTQLFPNEPMALKEGERVLVFLRTLPAYTAWRDLIAHGIQYDVLGGAKGIFKTSPDISLYADYAEQILKLEGLQDAAERQRKVVAFDEEILQKNPPGSISADIAADLFQLSPAASLDDRGREFWLSRAKDPRFSAEAKRVMIDRLSAVDSPPMNEALRQMFCLPPDGLCLKVAETLESRGVSLPLAVYAHSIDTGDEELRIGLLVILARHQRKDAFKLFESRLKQESGEKNAATLVEALGNFQTPQAEALALRYAKDPRYYVRIAVATSLGKLKSVKGIPVLEEYLKTRDPSMVAVTAQALKEIGTPLALQTLGKYYEMGHHGHWEPAEPQHFNLPAPNP